MKPMLIGHRGCRGIEPENTLRAIKNAMSIGADGVEIDVLLSKDKEAVVIHDDKLDRTTNGKGLVKNMTLKELRKLDAGKGEKIPVLQEVIDVVKDKIYLIIELKVKGTEKKVINHIKKNKLKNVIVISFIHSLVRNIKKIDKRIKTGCLFKTDSRDTVKIALDTNADFVFLQYKLVDKELVTKCYKKGIKVAVWNINGLKEIRKFSKLRLDIICSDKPDILINYFKNRKK